MENSPKTNETNENCCCSLPLIIRQNDAEFITCDENQRDVEKCHSCIAPICQKPIKIYANSRNYLACEQMLPLPRDCIHCKPNLPIQEEQPRFQSLQGPGMALLVEDDHCVDCLAPKCKPPTVEQVKEEKGCSGCRDELKLNQPEPELTKKSIKAIKKAVLKETNRYRRMHCACPLRMDDKLSAHAQEWAEHLASNDLLETRPLPLYGENIMSVRKPLFCVERLIKLWYQEKYNYDFIRPSFNLYSGHFTQMVWWETQFLGIGMASNNYRMWIVCNYYPAGNIRGHFKENVLPRKLLLSDSDMETDYIKISNQKKCSVEDRKPCETTKAFQIAKEPKFRA